MCINDSGAFESSQQIFGGAENSIYFAYNTNEYQCSRRELARALRAVFIVHTIIVAMSLFAFTLSTLLCTTQIYQYPRHFAIILPLPLSISGLGQCNPGAFHNLDIVIVVADCHQLTMQRIFSHSMVLSMALSFFRKCMCLCARARVIEQPKPFGLYVFQFAVFVWLIQY